MNEKIDLTTVREKFEVIASRQELGDDNMRAMVVTGIVVFAANEHELPIELKFDELQNVSRTAIKEIVGEISDEWLGNSDLIINKMLNEISARKI